MANARRNTGKAFMTPLENLDISGIRDLCFVLCKGLSRIKIIEGRTVTQPKTPKMTPFAITKPRSLPIVKDIKHSAMNPATVVIELPTTLASVAWMAAAIASL